MAVAEPVGPVFHFNLKAIAIAPDGIQSYLAKDIPGPAVESPGKIRKISLENQARVKAPEP